MQKQRLNTGIKYLQRRVMDLGLELGSVNIHPSTSLHRLCLLRDCLPPSNKVKNLVLHIAKRYNQFTTHTGLEKPALPLPHVFKEYTEYYLKMPQVLLGKKCPF